VRDATLDDGDAGGAFSPADRIVLSALAGGAAGEIDPWLDALADDPEFAPLCAAASAALSDAGGDAAVASVDGAPASRGVRPLGGPRARAAAALGRALSREAVPAEGGVDASDAFSRAVVTYGDTAPESPLFRALALELDLDGDRGARVARAVASLREVASERDSALAAAVLAEIAGDQRAAMSDLDRARAADPQHEGAARARAAQESGVGAARILAEHALTLDEGPRAAVLVTEAAIRLLDGGDNEEGERLLSRAAQIDPKLPVALHLGERSARARVDRDGLLEWLRTRREGAADPLERAHDLVREALLVAEADPAAAASLLETAHRSRPQDIGLRELFERLAPEPPADRASWRAERAAELLRALDAGGDGDAGRPGDDRAAAGIEAARLALEAALDHERAGDLAQAAACARQAIAAGDNALAPIALYRAAVAGHGTGELVDALIPRAREAADAAERLDIYERLAELDEHGRKDAGSALLWRRSILEETPHHLPTLRRVASYLISEGRDEELEPIALEIARVLDGPEAIAHALLSARLRLRVLPWEEALEPVQIAYRNEPRGIWALRQMAAQARAKADHALAIEADRQLIERTDRPSEAAALSVRAARDALLAGSIEDAVAFFRHAITLVPHYLVAHLDLADALDRGGDPAAAAAALESAAGASVGPEGRAHSLYAAAVLWQDKVQNVARARDVLEAVATVDPSYADVFSRLRAIYIAEGARAELAALLERRLEAVTDPAERVEMEVLRGRALADVGDAAAAKRALAAALDANPDHVEALTAFADVCAGEGDWAGAEQAWIRLARLVPEPAKQVAIYLRLGELYDEHLPNAERAELAYQEILKRSPGDVSARERLVSLYKRAGDGARALEQQNLLISAAEAPEQKCRRTAELAEIYEAMGDAKKAEATLLTARKTWPKDDFALGALASYYQRTEQASAATTLLDRALADARRALNTGRFEPYLFSTVATVAELRGRAGAAKIARATVDALDGRDAAMGGAGNAAGAARLDAHLAPELMTPAFRELLLKTGPLLDAAVPFDLDSIRATPLPPQHAEITDLARGIGAAYGLPGLQVYMTGALGAVCVPASTSPPKIVLGQALVTSPREDVRLALIHRAVKILQTNASAFSRTAPIDLWPLLAAYLKAFVPSWSPQGADAGRLREYHGRIERVMAGGVDPKISVLAADVIGSIGNRASTLNTAINGWGNRAAFLAVGDINVVLTGIAWSGGNTNAPPAAGKDRVTWIGRNAEARDLIVFAVSDGLTEAREQLGFNE
jgi:tetratricopeptide (TPR) repeat protein